MIFLFISIFCLSISITFTFADSTISISQIIEFQRNGFLFLPNFISHLIDDLRVEYLDAHVNAEQSFLRENFEKFNCTELLKKLDDGQLKLTASNYDDDRVDVMSSIEECRPTIDGQQWPDLQLSGLALRSDAVRNILHNQLFGKVASQLLQVEKIRYYTDAPFFKGWLWCGVDLQCYCFNRFSHSVRRS
jgi:hypothetical protein